jgi:hypothetical protein
MQHKSICPTNTITLEEVQEQFQQWRRGKSALNSPIPNYLWDQVAHIVEHYQQSDILRHLKISRYQLVTAMKSRQNPQDTNSIPTSISQEIPDRVCIDPFIKIAIPMTLDPHMASQQPLPMATAQPREQNLPKVELTKMELIHPNGVTMRITGMTDHQLSYLLSSFMGRD